MISRFIYLANIGDSPLKNRAVIFSLAFSVATIILFFSLFNGAEVLIERSLHGTIPNIVKAEPQKLSLGDLETSNTIGEDDIKALELLPEVERVYKIGRLKKPASLQANYSGQLFFSDILVELVSQDYIDLLRIQNNLDKLGDAGELDVLLPSSISEVLSSGVSIHTDLPKIDVQALVGYHFSLIIGSSSFSKTSHFTKNRCRIVGVSPFVGVGGPSISFEKAIALAPDFVDCSAILIQLNGEERALENVLQKLKELRLRIYEDNLFSSLANILKWIQISLIVFCALLVICVGFSSLAISELQIKNNLYRLSLYRALGASCRDILTIYFIKSFICSLISVILGFMMSLFVGKIINVYFAELFLPTPSIILIGSLSVMLVNCLFSIWPIVGVSSFYVKKGLYNL
ncbi:ABC transporter permease [bacterium]|nr:ABC transporter permease [bacterium]